MQIRVVLMGLREGLIAVLRSNNWNINFFPCPFIVESWS